MLRHYPSPAVITAAGNRPKIILEHIGRASSGTEALSIAHMKSPEGWEEPGQQPEFDEYTVVLAGALHVRTQDGAVLRAGPGEAIMAPAGEWVQYSTPEAGGAEYIAVCLPAFAPSLVHREPA